MTNKEKIYKFIRQRFLEDKKIKQDNGVDTEEVAKYLNILRPNASALLNALVNENILIKTKTRPVRYRLSDKVTHDAFDRLIGSKGSLEDAVKQAKAAVRFPGGILPIKLVAKSGSGVTCFCESIIQYAKEKNIIASKANYYEVNCLTSTNLNGQLFGNKKKLNIFNRYKNSVILIKRCDELNNTQIYKVNQLLDKNENLNNNLVIFFSNSNTRINTPISISLPNLNERPIEERLSIVQNFFEKQARSSKKSIIINSYLLMGLVNHKYRYGFKELEKDITLACAKAYLRSLDDRQDQQFIMASDFADNFIFDKTLDIKQSQELSIFMHNRENFVFRGNQQHNLINYREKNSQELYQNISKHYNNLTNQGLNSNFITQTVLSRIENLYDKYNFHINKETRVQDLIALEKLVSEKLIKLTDNFLGQASKELHRKFDKNIFYGLCLHLNSKIKFNNKSKPIFNSNEMRSLKIRYSKELKLTQDFVSELENNFNCDFSDVEIMIILTFLVEPRTEINKPVVLFAMHGNGAAHYISELTNALNHSYNSYAYDMQLNKSLEIVYSELKKLVEEINQGAGVIVIYDMGSFKEIFNRIIDQTHIPIRLINVPITLIGLEIARKCMSNTNIDDVYHNVITNLINYKQNNNKQNMIITLCHTGEGGAVQLQDYINQYSKLGWIIKPMSISNRHVLANKIQNWRKVYNIKAVIGTYDPNLFGIPFISISKVFENSHEKLDRILNFLPIETESTVYDKIYKYYESELRYVNISLLKETMPKVMDDLTQKYHLDEDVQIGLFTHIVGVLEDGLSDNKRQQGISYNYQNFTKLKNDFNFIQQVLRPLEKAFKFIFSDSDIYIIISIAKQIDNKKQ